MRVVSRSDCSWREFSRSALTSATTASRSSSDCLRRFPQPSASDLKSQNLTRAFPKVAIAGVAALRVSGLIRVPRAPSLIYIKKFRNFKRDFLKEWSNRSQSRAKNKGVSGFVGRQLSGVIVVPL